MMSPPDKAEAGALRPVTIRRDGKAGAGGAVARKLAAIDANGDGIIDES
jgi:hypothetical protein